MEESKGLWKEQNVEEMKVKRWEELSEVYFWRLKGRRGRGETRDPLSIVVGRLFWGVS